MIASLDCITMLLGPMHSGFKEVYIRIFRGTQFAQSMIKQVTFSMKG